jgi:hypothetical protein
MSAKIIAVDELATRARNCIPQHAVALHYMRYNFCRIHQTLRVTRAMEAGISDHVWSLDEVIALLD